jgi:hypothetical protein
MQRTAQVHTAMARRLLADVERGRARLLGHGLDLVLVHRHWHRDAGHRESGVTYLGGGINLGDACGKLSLMRTPPRRSWGRGPSPPGWRRLQARRSTCLLLRALQRRRVESLVLGALSSSPVHGALVLVLWTNIAVLLDCSKSSRQCSLSYLLTYLLNLTTHSPAPRHVRVVVLTGVSK